MQKSGKLELTWVGKYDTKVIEPRIFVEDFEKSYGDPNSQNMLIHGDNLIALQALIQDFAGKIKCLTAVWLFRLPNVKTMHFLRNWWKIYVNWKCKS